MASAITRRAILGGVAAALVDLRAASAQTAAPSDGVRGLEARPGEIKVLPGEGGKTACLTYEGTVPGPLLRVRQGEEVRLRLVNGLAQPTTLHWHGLRGQNGVDGVGDLTQKPVAAGQSADIAFKAIDAGLFLYRPAALPFSPEQIARGLCGALIVDEPSPPDVDGDHLLLFQDWKLDPSGLVATPFDDPAEAAGAGRLGNQLTVGAKPAPFTGEAAPGARLRLRIANGANARIMLVVFEGVRARVVAIDSQPCDPFEPLRQTLPVAPGARFDLVMDLPTQEKSTAKLVLREQGRGDRDLAVWTTAGAAAKIRPPIAALPLNPSLPAEIKLAQAKKVEIPLEPPKGGAKPGRWMMGGEARSYGGKPLFSVARGTPVSVGFTNRSTVAVPMHVHGHAVRLLHDLDDGWEPYWRNGVIVPAGRSKHVAFIADAPGKWALRSDIAEQEAAGLATWFEVT